MTDFKALLRALADVINSIQRLAISYQLGTRHTGVPYPIRLNADC